MITKTIDMTVSIDITYDTPEEYLQAIRDAKSLILNLSVESTYSVKPKKIAWIKESIDIKN